MISICLGLLNSFLVHVCYYWENIKTVVAARKKVELANWVIMYMTLICLGSLYMFLC